MKISIIGTGYVGTVTGTCLAELGHQIVFVVRDTKKRDLIHSGKSPIYEPGLDQLLEKNLARISTTMVLPDAIRKTELTFVCVGTPSNDDGSINLDQIRDVSHTIGKSLASDDEYHTIIVKSTVLPGTSETLVIPILEKESGKNAFVDFGFSSNPEFLKEGTAIEDFFHNHPNEKPEKMKISVIIPAYNEERALKPVVEEYSPYVNEIIIVDDGSNDSTYEIAKTLQNDRIRVFRHEKNQGKVAALRKGVEHATGDIVIFTDADCTYPARYIPEFVDKIEHGVDLVLGSRQISRENIPLFNRLGNFIFSSLAAYISGKTIADSQTGFRAFRKEMFEKFDVEAKSLEFETKMTVRAAKLGYKIAEIPIEYRARRGTSKLHPIRDGLKMFFGLLAIAWNETSPLGKMIMFPSFIFILIGIGFGSVALYERLTVYHLVHEYYPLIAVFSILLALQLMSIGLIVDFLTKKLDRIEEKLT